MQLGRLIRNRVIGIARRMRTRVGGVRPRRKELLALATVQRRLELLLGAMYGEHIGDGLMADTPDAVPHERSVVLPPYLPDTDDALDRYRLLAIEQGARIARGTRRVVPTDPMERDLFLIIEGAAIDAELVERAPGLSRMIARLRGEELSRRSRLFVGRNARPVEALLRELLAADPSATPTGIPRTASPSESATAARVLSNQIRAGRKKHDFYGVIDGIALWDHRSSNQPGAHIVEKPHSDVDIPLTKGSSGNSGSSDSDVKAVAKEGKGGDNAAADDRPRGDSDGGAGQPDDAADRAPAESGSAAQSQSGSHSSSDTGGAQSRADAPSPQDGVSESSGPAPGGIQYPEWVDRFKRLEPAYTTVFTTDAAEGDGAWARETLRAHAPLVRQLRDRFALLRARRLRLRAQRSGDELDLDACVNAMIDLRLKRVPSDRLYQVTRSSRHSLAFTILVDVSGSTKDLLPDGQRVIDVERVSVVLAAEALASLGDPYSIVAFSGKSRHDVRVSMLKGFGEADLSAMHRRVSILEPDRATRLGAAIRHATAQLLAQNAQRRVLLILSDGRPHDVDWYWSDAAIEDSRLSTLEARASGVHTFCLTVDSKEPEYLPHLFGEGRYWVLSNPTELPKALIRLIDTIITG